MLYFFEVKLADQSRKRTGKANLTIMDLVTRAKGELVKQ